VISCLIRLDAAGCLEGFETSGHAPPDPSASGGGGGVNLACAGATTLLRTASRLLYLHPELEVEGGAPEPGLMRLVVRRVPESLQPWLQGVTEFLLAGLRDLQAEHTGAVDITIRRKGTTDHGT